MIVREDDDRFLILFGWALGEYMWTVVADAAVHLGGGPWASTLDRWSAAPEELRVRDIFRKRRMWRRAARRSRAPTTS